ncbi:efflux RND transporter permease subunit [candidate division KSB1 bacterium]|nr:MAG: efflux RND transporter permease subunit [candidate division KSB1 bacterium]MCE7940583.1 efflux RND transporter permease subunit [Chlorobi bacterium CHB1]MDL1875067.1 efflux RND transporter permease subunit [Cytophagia bacterium CHB2]
MQWLVATSLRLRVAVVVLTVIFMIAGMRILSTTAFDVFPEFAPPLVEIQTEAPGLSTAEVEALISVPIENALNGTSWLKKIRSKSVLGLSSVVLYFAEDTDLLRARQLVQERLAQVAANLPSVAEPPVILSPLSSTSRVMKIGISSRTLSQVEMTTIAKWTIRPRLMAIPGVANVAIWGQRDRQIQVLVDPQFLSTHKITIDEVVRAARSATEISGGGFVDMPNQRLSVSHVSLVHTPQDLSHVPVAMRNGAPLTLGNITKLVEGFPPPIGDAVINDGTGLLLIVEKQPWGNTLDVTHKVEAALEALRPGLGDLEIDPTIFRPATFIEMSLANLNRAMLLGCLLVILVLAFFLNDWRTALISVLAIPTSLVAAALALHYQGGTINTMVLAGLVIALGEVVDDAIIDVENIMRRLRLNRAAGNPQSSFHVVLHASLEVRSAVVYGSVIVALVLLPVFLLEGLSGAFFRPLALSYVLAILASLLVALTLTPALSLLLLPRASSPQKEAPLVHWLKRRYEKILPRLLNQPKRVTGILTVTIILALLAFPFLGEEFLPHFKEYDFLMHWVEKPGTSLEAMQRITERASKELRAIPGVRNFGAHLGRAEVADEVVGPNFTELWISLDPQVDYEPTVAKIQKVVDGYPGLYRDVLTYLRERIKEVLTGTSATLVVRIYGENLDMLREHAEAVKAAISDVEGVIDLKVQPQILVPQVEVRIRPEAATRFGLTPGEVRRAATVLVKGVTVGEFYEEQKVFEVAVWGEPGTRNDVEAIRNLMIATPTGGIIPLREVADIIIAPTPNQITREAASRYTEVTCNVRGRDLGSVAQDIENNVRGIHFERGYHPEFLGEYAAQQASKNRIFMLSLLSVIGILLILHADFASLRLALLVLLSLPFALVGSIISVLLTGGVLSLGSLVGFVTVLGIAARNGIMLISHYRHLEQEESQPFGFDLIMRGAQERLAPILMTALAAALALLPIVLGGNRPGHEIEHPMAVVILGGLASSTVLNLFVMPVLYWRFGRYDR